MPDEARAGVAVVLGNDSLYCLDGGAACLVGPAKRDALEREHAGVDAAVFRHVADALLSGPEGNEAPRFDFPNPELFVAASATLTRCQQVRDAGKVLRPALELLDLVQEERQVAADRRVRLDRDARVVPARDVLQAAWAVHAHGAPDRRGLAARTGTEPFDVVTGGAEC